MREEYTKVAINKYYVVVSVSIRQYWDMKCYY